MSYYRALASCLRMIFSENRCTLFRIMRRAPDVRCVLMRALGARDDARGDLAAQPLQGEQRVGTGLRNLDALDRKVPAEEIEMRLALVELLRRQHRGEYRHLGS